MLLTCKDFIFSDFTWKKRFLHHEMVMVVAGTPPPAPSFPYGPEYVVLKTHDGFLN